MDLSIARDAANRQAWIDAKKPKYPKQITKEEWDRLTSARGVLLDTQSRRVMEFGDKAERQPEWKSLDFRMVQINQKLSSMKSSVFGPANF